MQKIAVLLRKSQSPNIFREIILDSFSEKEFDDILICSGFFQEKATKNASFFASDHFKLKPTELACKKTITIVGIYNHVWKTQFNDFVSAMSGISCRCGKSITVNKKQIKSYHWHAKIFIASSKGTPILGIIGSSNITSRAFGVLKNWNYEADVVLWDATNIAASKIMENALEMIRGDNLSEIIVSDYAINDPNNRGRSLSQRLEALRQDIDKIATNG